MLVTVVEWSENDKRHGRREHSALDYGKVKDLITKGLPKNRAISFSEDNGVCTWVVTFSSDKTNALFGTTTKDKVIKVSIYIGEMALLGDEATPGSYMYAIL